jgi:hypothetical protein
MNKIKKREIVIIIAVSFLIVLPFINQAYYIDDFIYLSAAQQYNEQGFDSFKNGTSDQEGYLFPNYYLTHPLLWPWFLAMFIKIFNTTNEVALHSISIITLIITGFSALLVSKRFSKEPLFSTLFFLFLPAVMLLSHVMMTDIPTVAFFFLALGLHLEGVEKKSILYLLFAGIAASISIGISYQALFILPLFIFYNFLKKEKKLNSYLSIAIPLLFFIGWCLYTRKELGIPHPLISFQWGYVSRNILYEFIPKFAGNINSIGAATIFPFFILIVYSLKHNFRKLLIISLIIAIAALLVLTTGYTFVQKTLFLTYFTAGTLLVLRIIVFLVEALKTKNKENIFLSSWFISFFAIVVLIMPLGVPRYLLPVFLPLTIIVVRDIKDLAQDRFDYAIWSVLCITILWGFLCSYADYRFAGIYRVFSEKIEAEYKGRNIWFCGDGLSFYMKKYGNKPVLYNGEKPHLGDIVIVTTELWSYQVPDVMERASLIDKIRYQSKFPIRTMNLQAHAGFHDHSEGALLPFSITRSKYEEFFIYKVIKD